jgi:hypothetical protein
MLARRVGTTASSGGSPASGGRGALPSARGAAASCDYEFVHGVRERLDDGGQAPILQGNAREALVRLIRPLPKLRAAVHDQTDDRPLQVCRAAARGRDQDR